MDKRTQSIRPSGRARYVLGAALSLAVAYVFASLAIDSGSYIHYTISIGLMITAVVMTVRTFRTKK